MLDEAAKHKTKETYLGIDIGGTCIKWGVVDDEGDFEVQPFEYPGI